MLTFVTGTGTGMFCFRIRTCVCSLGVLFLVSFDTQDVLCFVLGYEQVLIALLFYS